LASVYCQFVSKLFVRSFLPCRRIISFVYVNMKHLLYVASAALSHVLRGTLYIDFVMAYKVHICACSHARINLLYCNFNSNFSFLTSAPLPKSTGYGPFIRRVNVMDSAESTV
jgi:hypothetical protein